VPCTSAGVLVTYERALETHESSCVPRADKPFFIPVIHGPSGAVGHVATPELPSQACRAPSRGTRDSAGAHLNKEVRSGAVGHVVVPEPTSVGR
jgi:hypothetical protein